MAISIPLLSALAAPPELPSKPELPSQPQLTGPLPQTAHSYAFGAAAHQNVPLDLGTHGYIEEEYILRGRARVFDWGPTRTPVVVGQGVAFPLYFFDYARYFPCGRLNTNSWKPEHQEVTTAPRNEQPDLPQFTDVI